MAIASDRYVRLVEGTLTRRWSEYGISLCIDEEDWKTGIALLTQLAVEAMHTKDSAEEAKSPEIGASHLFSLEVSETVAVDKIKAFVHAKADRFRAACQTGFPFSLLDARSREIALRAALERYSSILSHFMQSEERWMHEGELDERFGAPFRRLQARAIGAACFDLEKIRLKTPDDRAGYYLLWLIKQAAGCTYEIPEQELFHKESVTEVLSQFFNTPGSRTTHPANLVEILLFQDSRIDPLLYQTFLDKNARIIFLNFAVEQLQTIPMDQWPNKAHLITTLFETLVFASQQQVAKVLSSSQDPTTAEVGHHLSSALVASSLREAIPHFYALKERLPHFDYTHVQCTFGRPFPRFLDTPSSWKEDPPFTRRLNFNEMRQLFIHNHLMLGVYNTYASYQGKEIPPYLLAYDIYTQKMVWGIPLAPLREDPLYRINKLGNALTLHFIGEKEIRFIDPETGEVQATLELPVALTKWDSLHITPTNFVYQTTRKHLRGGIMVDHSWISSFTLPSPPGDFYPLSTHCGFEDSYEERWVIVGPTGDQVAIESCLAAVAQDATLCTIEKDPLHKNQCLLTLRSLKSDHEVISQPEQIIELDVRQATFGKICHNAQLVLIADNSPIFVDLLRKEVTYTPHTFSEAYSLITDKGELWTWDPESREIWKTSSSDSVWMGSMKSGRATTLLHVDHAEHLYFADMRF